MLLLCTEILYRHDGQKVFQEQCGWTSLGRSSATALPGLPRRTFILWQFALPRE